jgi:hypothetical protein
LASFDVKEKKTLLGCDQSLSALQIGDGSEGAPIKVKEQKSGFAREGQIVKGKMG